MKRIELPEKACTYTMRIAPAVVQDKCVCLNNIYNENISHENIKCNNIKNKRKYGALIALYFVMILIFGFLCADYSVYNDMVSVVNSLFAPRDFGKIKFADNVELLEQEAFILISDFNMPFVACEAKDVGEVYLLSSGDEVTIKCAMDGKVENIENDVKTSKKIVTIGHSHGLKTIYSMIDYVGVSVGDTILKNGIVGVSLSGEVGFKINWNNKVIKGLEIVDGQLSFA